MDWRSIFSIVAIVLFLASMLRGGGMGSCSMGSHSRRHGDELQLLNIAHFQTSKCRVPLRAADQNAGQFLLEANYLEMASY
jgi:hypothetical protein